MRPPPVYVPRSPLKATLQRKADTRPSCPASEPLAVPPAVHSVRLPRPRPRTDPVDRPSDTIRTLLLASVDQIPPFPRRTINPGKCTKHHRPIDCRRWASNAEWRPLHRKWCPTCRCRCCAISEWGKRSSRWLAVLWLLKGKIQYYYYYILYQKLEGHSNDIWESITLMVWSLIFL